MSGRRRYGLLGDLALLIVTAAAIWLAGAALWRVTVTPMQANYRECGRVLRCAP